MIVSPHPTQIIQKMLVILKTDPIQIIQWILVLNTNVFLTMLVSLVFSPSLNHSAFTSYFPTLELTVP